MAEDVAAIFASAWTAGAGAALSEANAVRLRALYAEAARTQPDLDPREFAVALAQLAPGADGLAAFFDNRILDKSPALAATAVSGDVAVAATAISGKDDAKTRDSAPVVPRSTAPPAPERYRLIKELGSGAMGVVWEAEDKQLHRRIALKWVKPHAAGDKGYRTRLFREARALAQLHHPNVLAVHDVGEVGDEVYIAMELVDGSTARAWMDADKRSTDELLRVWRDAGRGIAAVHAAGLVHRDIKPENVFVAKDGRVVVGDFGLATGELGETVAVTLTQTGAVVGTPLYMPPEQLHGDVASPKGDQFSLAVCFWEALAGKRPFEATTIAGLAVQMLSVPVPPAGMDRRIATVLHRGLATEASERWPDVPAMLAALDLPAKRSHGPALAIGGALVVGVIGTIALQHALRSKDAPVVAAVAPADAVAPPVDVPALVVDAPAPTAAVVTPDAGARPTRTKPKRVATNDEEDGSDTAEELAAHDAAKRYNQAINAMRDGDGKQCLALIADLETWPRSELRNQEDARMMRGICTMLAGDCAGGRALLRKWLATTRLDAQEQRQRERDEDAHWCALDAPPAEMWPDRARSQLQFAEIQHRSCAPIQQFIDAHHVALPYDGKEYSGLRSYHIDCLISLKRCDEARDLFMSEHKSLPDVARQKMLEVFAPRYAACRGT